MEFCTGDKRTVDPVVVVPLCITNIVLHDTPDGKKKTFSKSTSGEKGDAVILKNVIDMGDCYEAELVEHKDATSVLSKALADSGREEALFYVHGWDVDCRLAIDTVIKMNGWNDNEEESPKKLLVLPILWAATWDNLWYGDDRNTSAPEAATNFSALSSLLNDVLQNSSVKKSIIAHSMGNYVLRIFAQNYTSNEPVFENVFMVAPDVRWDLFNQDYISRGEIETQENAEKANGGLQIALLAKNKVHVLYTVNDVALLFRQTWHRFFGNETSALGRCAGFAMDTVHSSLKNKIVFHDCGYMQPRFGVKHSYNDTELAMKYYETPEPNGVQTKARMFFPKSIK